jgi:hypothetical protein
LLKATAYQPTTQESHASSIYPETGAQLLAMNVLAS